MLDLQNFCPSCSQHICFQAGVQIKFCPHCGAALTLRQENDSRDFTTWKRIYRKETNPLQRLNLLVEISTSPAMNQAQIKARQLFWEHRFQSRPHLKQPADLDLQFIQTLVICTENKGWLNARKGRKSIEKYWNQKLNLLRPLFGENKREIHDLISEEFYHLIYSYLELCRKDKSFNSFLFGMGKVKPETAFYRMKKQMDQIASTFFASEHLPVSIAEPDLTLLHSAFSSAFTDYWNDFPIG